jgi:hypothetical protein
MKRSGDGFYPAYMVWLDLGTERLPLHFGGANWSGKGIILEIWTGLGGGEHILVIIILQFCLSTLVYLAVVTGQTDPCELCKVLLPLVSQFLYLQSQHFNCSLNLICLQCQIRFSAPPIFYSLLFLSHLRPVYQ